MRCSPERVPPVNAMAAEPTAQTMTTALMTKGIAGGTVIDGSSLTGGGEGGEQAQDRVWLLQQQFVARVLDLRQFRASDALREVGGV